MTLLSGLPHRLGQNVLDRSINQEPKQVSIESQLPGPRKFEGKLEQLLSETTGQNDREGGTNHPLD